MGRGVLVGYYGHVELHMRLLCWEVFVGEETMKIGGDWALEVQNALYLKLSQFEV